MSLLLYSRALKDALVHSSEGGGESTGIFLKLQVITCSVSNLN